MHKLFFAMLAAAMICVAGQGARAEVPALIPVVGVFADADDNLLEGSHTLVFTLYNAETGGMTLWGETQQVTFTDGLFRVYLGSTSVDGMDITDFIDNDSVWLGVKVGADGEMNRVRLASVPWAFEAETCREVADLSSAGIQPAIGAAACGANQAMRGWSGSAAVCVDLPSTAGLVANTDIGVTVQAPISQSQPCSYGIGEITAGGAVTCVPDREVVLECGPEAAGGNLNNYLGSDGACHKAIHSCTADQYLAGGATGACQEASHKCTASQYIDGDGTCRTAPHSCPAGQYLDGDGTCTALAVSGTTGTLARFTSGTAVGNSIITQSGTTGVTVGGTATVTGAATLSSTATVTGAATFNGTATLNGVTTVNNYLVATGGIRVGSASNPGANNLSVVGTTTTGRLKLPADTTIRDFSSTAANYDFVEGGPYACDSSTVGHIAVIRTGTAGINVDSLCWCARLFVSPTTLYTWYCIR
jgi:hypothetical protein